MKTLAKAEIKKFAKVVSDTFLEDMDNVDLQSVTQDEIDAFIIPIMTEVEDIANDTIAVKVKDSFEADPLSETDDWWDDDE